MSSKTPREIAFDILLRVIAQGAFADRLLHALTTSGTITPRESALVQQLVKGVLEQRSMLATRLNAVLSRELTTLPQKIQIVLEMGAYQLLHLTNTSPKRAVSEAVSLARAHGHEGTAKLVNAVLRKLAASKADLPETVEALGDIEGVAQAGNVPVWIATRLVQQVGHSEALEVAASWGQRLPVNLRVNTLKTTKDQLQQRLGERRITTLPSVLCPDSLLVLDNPERLLFHELPEFTEGLFFIQDESSAVIAPLLKPQPGEFIIDLCAAPGGKTTHLATLAQDQARVLAVDRSPKKARLIRENCERLGLSSLHVVVADGAHFATTALADKVLVDAPCSGLGAIGKKKDIRWNRKESDMSTLVALQLSLLRHALTLVRVGGVVCYSTCSIDREENEGVIETFIEESSGSVVLQQIEGAVAGELGLSGAALRIWPHRHKSTGSFGCLLRRER